MRQFQASFSSIEENLARIQPELRLVEDDLLHLEFELTRRVDTLQRQKIAFDFAMEQYFIFEAEMDQIEEKFTEIVNYKKTIESLVVEDFHQ